MKISIILPIYNESEVIKELYGEIKKIQHSEVKYIFEFIFINDGSSDSSLDILSEIASRDSSVKIINFSRNFGHQFAITAGYDYASGDAIITMDSDLQDPPEVIPKLIKQWVMGNDVVYARRKNRDDGFLKKLTANMYYRLMEKTVDFEIPRNVGDFRLIDRKVLVELKKCREKFRYLRGMVAWVGFKHSYVDFDRPNRKYGKTSYTWVKMFKLAFDGLTGFSMFPLKIAAYFGVLVITMSVILFFLGIYDYVVNSTTHPMMNWLIDIIFGFMGVQFLLFWFLGEYVGRIHDQAKNRPLYIVDEKINFEK